MMKKILLICAPLIYVFLIGCGGASNTKKELSEEEIYQNKINDELLKDTIVNDIFLNFNFGDNLETIMQKADECAKSNDLFIASSVGTNMYTYFWYFDEEKRERAEAYTDFDFEYFDNKLYKLTLSVKPTRENSWEKASQIKADLLYYDLCNMFDNKYGYTYIQKKQILFPLEEGHFNNRYWIHGNRQISIEINHLSVDIIYTNLLISEKAETLQRKEKMKKEEAEVQKQKQKLLQSETDI